MVVSMNAVFGPPAGWYADPVGAGSLRYWSGSQWTPYEATRIAAVSRAERAPFEPLPVQAAVAALVLVTGSLIASKFLLQWLIRYEWPLMVYVAIAILSAYGPSVLGSVWISRRWGSGGVRHDFGVRFRWVDLGWGPVTFLSALGAEIAVALTIVALKVPIASNTEGIAHRHIDRTYVIALGLMAVVAAPIVEELIFRGVVMRGLRSVMPAWLCVGVQGVLFGTAHFDPSRGMGNIGLVIILSSVGVMFGGSAYLLRRLAPTMVAHALFNTFVLILVLNQ